MSEWLQGAFTGAALMAALFHVISVLAEKADE